MMWEYIGTLFFGTIALILGYALGRLKGKKDYEKGYQNGIWDGTLRYTEEYWEYCQKKSEGNHNEKGIDNK